MSPAHGADLMSKREERDGTSGKGPGVDYGSLPMMDVSLGDEFRREEVRFPTPEVLTEVLADGRTQKVQVRIAGHRPGDLTVCLLQDLSKNGIGFACKTLLNVGQTVRLEVVRLTGTVDKVLFQFDAKIIRADTSPGDLIPNLYGATAPEKYTVPLIQTAINSIVHLANKELGLSIRLVKSEP